LAGFFCETLSLCVCGRNGVIILRFSEKIQVDSAFCFSVDCVQEQLRNLGLQADWSDAYRKSYYAVLEGGQVKEERMAGEKLERV
jgi:hypothetical protein